MVVLSDDETDAGESDVLLVGDIDRDRLVRVITPQIRWVHVLSTGVDGFPFDLDGRSHSHLLPGRERRRHLRVRPCGDADVREAPARAVDLEQRRMARPQLGQLSGRTLGLVGHRRDRHRHRQARSRISTWMCSPTAGHPPLPRCPASRSCRLSTIFWPRRTTW